MLKLYFLSQNNQFPLMCGLEISLYDSNYSKRYQKSKTLLIINILGPHGAQLNVPGHVSVAWRILICVHGFMLWLDEFGPKKM